MTAYDLAFAADQLLLDPLFGALTPFVRDRRVEPFVANVLKHFLDGPPDSWSTMVMTLALEHFALDTLAGIVTASRSGDLAPFVLAHADPVQDDGLDPAAWFARERARFIGPDGGPASFVGSDVTFDFRGNGGSRTGLVVVSDDLILGRAQVIARVTGPSLRERLDPHARP